MLDRIHNQGLRLCLGAFRTSPVYMMHTNRVCVLDMQSFLCRLTFMSPCFIFNEAGTSLDGDAKVCFLTFLKFVAYPAILALGANGRKIRLPSLPWSCLLLRLVCPIMIFKIQLPIIFFPLGKMIEMVRLRTRFILPSQSWEIGSHTGSGGRM